MTITMPRGDIRDVRFKVYDPTDQISDIDFDQIYFTVKKRAGDSSALIQKTLAGGDIVKLETGSYQFRILANDTDNLAIGEYAFDIELCYENSIKQTTVGILELTPEVTHAANEGN